MTERSARPDPDVEQRHPAWAELVTLPLGPGDPRGSNALPGVAASALERLEDPLLEVRQLLAGEGSLVPLAARGALALTGGDRVEFLHGQVSHDVRGLAVGEARESLLLDHRGRPRADLVVVRRDDDLYLSVDDGRVDEVLRSLDAHVVFDAVEIRDLSTLLASFVVSGEVALAALAGELEASELPRAAGTLVQLPWRGTSLLLHARPRGLEASVDVHVLSEQLPELWRSLVSAGARPLGERALAAARVAAGLASAAFEGAEALPQEAGLEERVSYTKGCYLGQEIMARVEARGTLRRSLARLRFEEQPQPGVADDALELRADGGRVLGRLGTVALTPDGAWRALAVVRSEVEEGAELEVLGASARVERRLP